MASESRKIVLITAACLAVGLGGTLYYLLVYQPGKDREAARAEIAAWERPWREARDCLLGREPLAAEVADAMTARELVIGTTDAAMGDCTKLVGGLTRPPGASSAVDAVERAWPVLEQATTKVASAYAEHRVHPLGDNPLPAALDELAAAYAALRAAAGMPAAPGTSGPPAKVLTPTPLVLDGAPVADLGGVTVDGALRGRANVRGKGMYDVTWTAAGLTGTEAAATMRSLPSRAWAVEIGTATAAPGRRGPDAAGETLVTVPDQVVIASATAPIAPLAVIGEAAERIVAFSVGSEVRVARSIDAGKTWAVEPLPARGDVAFAAAPAGDRLQLAWTDPRSAPPTLAVTTLTVPGNAGGPLPAPNRLAAQELTTWCAGGALWLVGATPTGYRVFRDGAAPGVELAISQPRPIACNAARIALRPSGDDAAADVVCSDTRCAPLPATGDERAFGLVGEHTYRADSRGRIVAVWRDDAAPVFYRIPAPRDVYGVVEVGGAPVLLLADTEAMALEQAPLP